VRRFSVFILSVSILLMTFASHAAEQRGWWEFWDSAAQQSGVADQLFSAEEQSLIRAYFGEHGYEPGSGYEGNGRDKAKKKKKLPPGLKKKLERGGELPPGWQKKLARGEVLDDELYAASLPLPQDLLERLGNGAAGTEMRRIEDEVVRVIEATGVIVDVLGL
jgi:hypothetical protein